MWLSYVQKLQNWLWWKSQSFFPGCLESGQGEPTPHIGYLHDLFEWGLLVSGHIKPGKNKMLDLNSETLN